MTDLNLVLSDSRPIRDAGAQPEGEVHHPDLLVGLSASLHLLAKDVADALIKRWPGFLWAVQPDQRGQIINVFCLNFSGEWGYTIRVTDIQDDPKRKEAIRAGGEILRRFGYTLDRFDAQAANHVPRDFKGEGIPDISDMPASRKKLRAELDAAHAAGRTRELVMPDGTKILEVVK